MPLYLEYQKIKQFVSNAESLHHAFLTPAPAATREKNADQRDSVRHVEPVSRTDSQPPEFLLFCFVWLLRELCWLQLSRLNGSQFPIKNAWCPMHACFCIFPSRAVFYLFFFLSPLSITWVCICHLFSIKHVSRTWVTSLTQWKFPHVVWLSTNDRSERLKAKYHQRILHAHRYGNIIPLLKHFEYVPLVTHSLTAGTLCLCKC